MINCEFAPADFYYDDGGTGIKYVIPTSSYVQIHDYYGNVIRSTSGTLIFSEHRPAGTYTFTVYGQVYGGVPPSSGALGTEASVTNLSYTVFEAKR
jgi:hypothetical protein